MSRKTISKEEILEKIYYGPTHVDEFTIAKASIGNSDADRNGTSTYSAPSGYRILSHQIEVSDDSHHYAVSHVSTTQPGELSFDTEVMSEIYNKIKQGFAAGKFHYEEGGGGSSGSGSIAANYARFLRDFEASFKFFAKTNSQAKFFWAIDSRTWEHGAKIDAYAVLKLEKVPTETDAKRALEAIKFVLETDLTEDIMDLIKASLDTDFQEGTIPKGEGDKKKPEAPSEEGEEGTKKPTATDPVRPETE